MIPHLSLEQVLECLVINIKFFPRLDSLAANALPELHGFRPRPPAPENAPTRLLLAPSAISS